MQGYNQTMSRNHMDQRGRPPNLANAANQPYGPYSQTGPNSGVAGQMGGQTGHPNLGQGQMLSGQQQQQQQQLGGIGNSTLTNAQQHPGQVTGLRQPNQMGGGGITGIVGPNQMGGGMGGGMNNATGPMGIGGLQNQMGVVGPRGPQPQPRSMNSAQQQQLQQKKPRYFLAMFDYDPSTMSPNPDGCEEELAFQEGDQIKVSADTIS